MPIVTEAEGLGAQNLTTYPDVPITGGVAAPQLLPVNNSRVTAYLYKSGSNSARVGDTHIGASQSLRLAANARVTIETTTRIYAYSASGTTLSYKEAVRL
jgi:hypothetical protein